MKGSLPGLRPSFGELRVMTRLAAPIVLVNVGMQSMGLVDTIMLGRVSAEALAAGALGNFYHFISTIIGIGILMSLDPIIAQAVGARDEPGIARGVQRGVILSVGLALAVSVAYVPADHVFRFLRQPADVTELAARYVWWSIPGLLPFFVFNMMRQTLQAMRRLRYVVLAVLAANVVNGFLNWVFIFGHLGFEAGGVSGAAQASSVSRWFMMLTLAAGAWTVLRPAVRPWRPESLRAAPLWRMLRLGLPVGMQFLAEAGAFGFVTVMAGWMGTVTLAGHEIALNLAAMTFMVPLGVAGAAAVMVGHAIGAGDTLASRRDAVTALACGIGFMAAMALLFANIPGVLANAYTTDSATRVIATALIPIAAVFQVFDGAQVISAAVLRGSGDTRVPMILHTLSFWAVGIPFGALLAFGFDFGAQGLWWGLTVGLAAAAVLQLARVRHRFGAELTRVVIDQAGETTR